MTYKIRVCLRCGQEYQPTSGPQKHCVKCRIMVNRERHNSDEHKRRLSRPEQVRVAVRKWRLSHAIEARDATTKWKLANPEQERATAKIWGMKNPEYFWKRNARRRTLGFNSLNSPFVGGEGHHINQSDIIYIPAEMHKSVSHNVWTGKNMDKINALAGRYLMETSL